MYKRIKITLMLAIILCITLMGINVKAEDGLTLKLKENLIPLKTTQAENGFEDLMPLKEILKDKKIIGIGEATHGTAEFFEMKHRIFEFLVEEMGYRVFAIEAEFGGSQIVNDYILYGKGSIDECLEAMKFWTWNTQEVADMIEWMKNYNEKSENIAKIKFYGYDMQSMDNDRRYIVDYLEKVESPSKDGIKELNSDLGDVHKELIKNKDTYIWKTSVEEYDLILQHMEIINQWKDHNNGGNFETRDYYMAQNIKWILDYETKYYGNDKIMLWAHNGHISKKYYNLKTMGKHLKDMYNEDYYAIGFDFYEGSFVAMPSTIYGRRIGQLSKFHINSSPIGSYADEMAKTEIPISFLDFNNGEKDKILLEFLSSDLHVNNIGATYFGKWHNVNPMNKTVIRDTFDSMIFVKSTTEAKRTEAYIGKISDGNKVLLYYYTFIIILLGTISIVLYNLYKRRSKSSSGEMTLDKFYILGKDIEDKKDINIGEKLIIRINNYLNSISSFKYFLIILCNVNIISIISILINPSNISNNILFTNGKFGISKLILYISLGIIETVLFYILPLNISKVFSEDKTIKLNQILITSTILAIFTTKNYFNLGILLYSLNVLLSFIHYFIYNYTYGLFYYKRKKPLIMVLTISIIESIIILLGLILSSKI